MSTVIDTGLTETIENRRNLIPNPSPVALAGSGWVAASGSISAGWVLSTSAGTTTPYIFTSRSARAFGIDEPVSGAITVRSDSANIPFLRVGFQASPGSGYYAGWIVVPTPVGVPVTVEISQTLANAAAAGSLGLTIVPCNAAGVFFVPTAGSVFGARDPIIEKAATAGTFFNGSTAVSGDRSYTWAGDANASESIEWLTRPVQVAPVLVDGYESTREALTVVHQVVNKTFPDVTLRAAGPRKGRLRMLFETEADAVNAFAVLSVPQAFTISDPDVPGMAMRFVIAEGDLSIGLDDETRAVWWVEVPFVEVAP